MSDLGRIEQQISDAADFVVDKVDGTIDSVGGMLTGESGRKLVGGAAVGAAAAVVLPVSLVGGALLGAGYAAFRQLGRAAGRPEGGGSSSDVVDHRSA